MDAAKGALDIVVEWLSLVMEGVSILIVATGLVVAAWTAVYHRHNKATDFTRARLTFARYLSAALELQLAADILSTAVDPSWEEIGKLAAIAAIRTALNYFLMLEMRQEEAEVRRRP